MVNWPIYANYIKVLFNSLLLITAVIICMQNSSREFLIISVKVNVLQLKLGCFVSVKIVHKVLTLTFRHQQPVNSAARNNHTFNFTQSVVLTAT